MYTYASPVNPIASALIWLQGTLLGIIATAVAVIAVASVGFLMLAGRIDVRRAVQVILGCFVLFGASTIAAGIEGALAGTPDQSAQPATESPPPDYPSAPPPMYPQQKPPVTDPYAGAAVPTRQ